MKNRLCQIWDSYRYAQASTARSRDKSNKRPPQRENINLFVSVFCGVSDLFLVVAGSDHAEFFRKTIWARHFVLGPDSGWDIHG